MNNWIRVHFAQIQLRNIIVYVYNIYTNFRRGRLSIWIWCSCSYLNTELWNANTTRCDFSAKGSQKKSMCIKIQKILGIESGDVRCLGLKSYLFWTVFNAAQNLFSQIYFLNLQTGPYQGSSRYLWFWYLQNYRFDQMYNYSNGWYNIWYGYPVRLLMDIPDLAQLRFYK